MSTVATCQWEQISSLPASFQTDHSFGFALDGKGYIMTGQTSNSRFTNAMYEYDPFLDTWTQMDNFPGGIRGFGIGDTYEGKAYFGFGFSIVYERDLWEWDPATQEWTELPSCPCTPRTHPAMVAHDGNIYVGLGGSANGNLRDWWVYNIADQIWSELTRFPAAARHHPFMFAIGDYVFAGFGHGDGFISDQWYRYDPSDDSWMEVASIPSEGRVAGQQFSHNGLGYILSGDGSDHRSMDTGEFWSYDPETDDWTQLDPHPGKARWAPASFVLNGEVYILNGPSFFSGQGLVYQPENYKYNLEPITSTEEISQSAIGIQPNPSQGEVLITIPSGSGHVNIIEASGQIVRTLFYDKPLTINDLQPGVYFIEYLEKDARSVEKLVVH